MNNIIHFEFTESVTNESVRQAVRLYSVSASVQDVQENQFGGDQEKFSATAFCYSASSIYLVDKNFLIRVSWDWNSMFESQEPKRASLLKWIQGTMSKRISTFGSTQTECLEKNSKLISIDILGCIVDWIAPLIGSNIEGNPHSIGTQAPNLVSDNPCIHTLNLCCHSERQLEGKRLLILVGLEPLKRHSMGDIIRHSLPFVCSLPVPLQVLFVFRSNHRFLSQSSKNHSFKTSIMNIGNVF